MGTAPWNSQRFRFLVADEQSILGVKPTGELMRFSHWNDVYDAPRATEGTPIGTDWAQFTHLFTGGRGTIYAVRPDGALLWYRYYGRGGTVTWGPQSGNQIGCGWQHFRWIFSGGSGLIYAIDQEGRLFWYCDIAGDGSNSPDGATGWDTASGSQIGFDWGSFRHVLSGGEGVIYAVTESGAFLWYRDDFQNGSNGAAATMGWASASGSEIGHGWEFFTHLFAGAPGQVFACETTEFGGRLIEYRDNARDGTKNWSTIGDLGIQIRNANFSAGWQIASVEGYPWPPSASAGEKVGFHASSMSDGAGQATIVRLTGKGPEFTTHAPEFSVADFPLAFRSDNGFALDCAWPVSYELTIPATVSPGFYAARVRGPTGPFYDIPFVVRRGPTRGDILLVASTNTWNAYNCWGGADNYTETASPIDLTLKRPNHHLLTASRDIAKGTHMLRSEIWLADWLQSRGYQVDFATDLDVQNEGFPQTYKAVVLNTHPEYWTEQMMDHLRAYLDGGGSLLYLGGNGMYRPTRLRAQTPGGEVDLMTAESDIWATSTFPLYGNKPLLAARVDLLGGPGVGRGIVLNPGAGGFVPASVPGTPVGTAGRNGPPVGGAISWGASGWETDYWPAPLPPDMIELGRDPGSEGAVLAMYRTASGGFVLGAGSLTFVGAMVDDQMLSAVIENALQDALSR